MPRVLRIINRLNLGGPTYNAANLTKYLDPDFETLLLAGMRDDTEESSEHITEELGIKPLLIKEMYRELNPWKDFRSYQKIRSVIREFKPDIVHTHAAKAGTVGRLAAMHENVPVIVHTFHGHVFHSYFSPLKTRMFLEIERFLAKQTTAIISLSEIQKHELTEHYHIAVENKIHIIPLGFDLSKFTEGNAEKRKHFRTEWHIEEDELAIGIIGRLVPIKNHELFLRAVKKAFENSSKKIRVFIIGDGEERKRLEQLCDALGLSHTAKHGVKKQIAFTSWMKDIDVALAGLDIVALSSLNEGTPVTLIEAQASGKPIVSTNVGGIANIVQDGKTALLSPSGDIDAFAENLLKLTEDENFRNQLSGNGVSFVMENFSHLRLAKDMGALYRELLSVKLSKV